MGEDNDGQEEIRILEYMWHKYVRDLIKAIVDFLYPSFLSELQSDGTSN